MDSAEQEVVIRRKIAEADTEEEKRTWSVNLRGLLLRGHPPCEGSIFCDQAPDRKCAAGEHDTCPRHASECASCQSKAARGGFQGWPNSQRQIQNQEAKQEIRSPA